MENWPYTENRNASHRLVENICKTLKQDWNPEYITQISVIRKKQLNYKTRQTM